MTPDESPAAGNADAYTALMQAFAAECEISEARRLRIVQLEADLSQASGCSPDCAGFLAVTPKG